MENCELSKGEFKAVVVQKLGDLQTNIDQQLRQLNKIRKRKHDQNETLINRETTATTQDTSKNYWR